MRITGTPNPRWIFGNFVATESNHLLLEACQRVAEPLAEPLPFSLLFLHGESGSGKTHLLHAVANQLSETAAAGEVILATAEDFASELISSIRRDRMEAFRHKYRSAEIFLLDHLEFVYDKEKTQEELALTLSALAESGSRVIVASSTDPKNFSALVSAMESKLKPTFLRARDLTSQEMRSIVAAHCAAEEKPLPDVLLDQICEAADNLRQAFGLVARLKLQRQIQGTYPPKIDALARQSFSSSSLRSSTSQ